MISPSSEGYNPNEDNENNITPTEFHGGVSPEINSENVDMSVDLGATALNSEILPERPEENESIRSNEVFKVSRDPDTYEVTIESDIELEDYQDITSPEDWEMLNKYAEKMRGKSVAFINPTMEGGGVAMLRPPLVHLLKMQGVDAHWYVMEGPSDPDSEDNPFLFTKQMHNITQRRTPSDERITEAGKSTHRHWSAENARVLYQQETLQTSDIIVIDDPQPAPLIPGFKSINPDAKIIWRDHIDNDGKLMEDPSTPQGEVWDYLYDECGVGQADSYIFHPVEKFVPNRIYDKTYFAPATVEPHDDLNKELSYEEITEGISFINNQISEKNAELQLEGNEIDMQSEIDPSRPLVTLIARFDESKGMDKAMDLGVRARNKLIESGVDEADLPQIVIVGNGSVDDPSGIPMYEKTLEQRRSYSPEERKDIISLRLKHNYASINSLMYVSSIGLQTSEAEGCETRISDWIEHEVPVIISNRGGMPLQVQKGKSGYILDYDKPDYDLERGAEIIADLLSDPEKLDNLRESTAEAAEEFNSRQFTTIANITRWLRIFDETLSGKVTADKHWQMQDLAKEQ